MDEFVLTTIGDLELSRRMLLKQLQEAKARIEELEQEADAHALLDNVSGTQ